MKYVRYLHPMPRLNRNTGDHDVISDLHARMLEQDGLAIIEDHPQFPHPFAGLPPPIDPPRPKKHR